MDVLYLQFSPRGQAILDVLTYLLFFLFIVVMLVYGIEDAIWSWSIKEVSKTPFHPPMYPIRTALPVGAFLILLQGLAHFIRALHMAMRGRDLE